MKHLSILSAVALIAAGCQVTPPATHISFNPKTKQFDLDSPKQVNAAKISVEDKQAGVTVAIEGLKSENDAAIISAVADYQLKQGAQMLQALDKILAVANAMGAKAVTGGLAP